MAEGGSPGVAVLPEAQLCFRSSGGRGDDLDAKGLSTLDTPLLSAIHLTHLVTWEE